MEPFGLKAQGPEKPKGLPWAWKPRGRKGPDRVGFVAGRPHGSFEMDPIGEAGDLSPFYRKPQERLLGISDPKTSYIFLVDDMKRN